MMSINEFVMKLTSRLNKDEQGQGVVEYGLILALVVVGAIIGLTAIGGGVATTFGNISAAL